MRWNDKNLFSENGKENALRHDRPKLGGGRKLGSLDVNLRRQQQQHVFKRRSTPLAGQTSSSSLSSDNFSPEDLRSIRHHLRTNLTLAKRRMMARLSMSTAPKDIQMFEYLQAAATAAAGVQSSADQQPPKIPIFSSNDNMPPLRRAVRATELFYPHGGWSDSLVLGATDLSCDIIGGGSGESSGGGEDEHVADDMMSDLLNLDAGYCS